ncbi:MAG: UDP-N-acetylmuramoyl-tripeptide--D-alanyl-D-alanine ligase [Candidatus Sumerlaeia bacterium]|nr:UDP-N-acetylmuramoyl-tripeptide--D-alanyl-D-alanine ligase [Candidatus Sumerlaeia bacterium]
MRLSVHDIVESTGGLLVRGSGATVVERVCTDTRILQPGDLFVAISGDRFDGNEFAAAALKAGAAGVVCETRTARELPAGSGFVVEVDNGTAALGLIARAWRRRLDTTIVGLTGSSGKTTTKELTAHLCTGSLPVFATEGNKNNHVGLPLMMLRLEPTHRAAILEMGMNHSGEIAWLTSLAEPDIGLLTNIGDAHLGNFPDHDALIAAKAELFETMGPDGMAILNADCPNTRKVRPDIISRRDTILFGESEEAQVRACRVEACEPFGYRFDLSIHGHSFPAYLPVFGRYQVTNALAATCVAIELGVPIEAVVERLGTFQAPQLRSHVQTIAGVRVIEDCYNASPAAVRAALASFAQLSGPGRRFVLLGDMNELGAFAEACHRRVGRAAARAQLDGILCVGGLAQWIAFEAAERGAPAWHFDTIEAAVDRLAAIVRPDDVVLVKGSRIARLERALGLLRAALEPDSPREACAS